MNAFVTPPLEQLISEWEKDSNINITDPGKEIIRIPLLHSKYNKYLTLYNLAARRTDTELAKTRKIKWSYYNGRMDQAELNQLGLEPFQFTLKSDLSVYMDSDPDMSVLVDRKYLHQECASFCINVMKELNNRTWQLKEHMAHARFEAGGH